MGEHCLAGSHPVGAGEEGDPGFQINKGWDVGCFLMPEIRAWLARLPWGVPGQPVPAS